MELPPSKLDHPRVSIVLPVYNAATTVGTAIESVLGQTLHDFELIIIDDGSTDTTSEVIQLYTDSRIIHSTNQQNLGLITTLNNAITSARGRYIARIDADDRWIDPQKLEQQALFLDTNPEHVLIGTQAIFKTDSRLTRTAYQQTNAAIRKGILSKNPFIHSSCMIRGTALEPNPYYPNEYLVEDYGLWLRLGRKGGLANLSESMVEYTVNPNSISQKNNLAQTRASFALVRQFRHEYPGYVRAYALWRLKIILRSFLGAIK